jgi:hypothetical protein
MGILTTVGHYPYSFICIQKIWYRYSRWWVSAERVTNKRASKQLKPESKMPAQLNGSFSTYTTFLSLVFFAYLYWCSHNPLAPAGCA